MARQKIVNLCPYKKIIRNKCPDYEPTNGPGVKFCLSYSFDECLHPDPKQLIGYAHSDEEVEEIIRNWKK